MRKIAYIKNAVPNAEGKKIKRIMLYSTSDDEVYVFSSDSAFDLIGTGYDDLFLHIITAGGALWQKQE